MKIQTAFDIDGKPAMGTFGPRNLEDLRLASDAGMNLVTGGRTFLTSSHPPRESSASRRDQGPPYDRGASMVARAWQARSEREIPTANGRPLTGPSVIQIDDELIHYESADQSGLNDFERSMMGISICKPRSFGQIG